MAFAFVLYPGRCLAVELANPEPTGSSQQAQETTNSTARHLPGYKTEAKAIGLEGPGPVCHKSQLKATLSSLLSVWTPWGHKI